jgi:hypothetical protein
LLRDGRGAVRLTRLHLFYIDRERAVTFLRFEIVVDGDP